jgi:hypothetical protein
VRHPVHLLGACAVAACSFPGTAPRDGSPPADEDASAVDAVVGVDAVDDAAPAPDAPRACPASYMVVGATGSAYRFVATAMTWPLAEAACEADGPGIHLAVIDDSAENDVAMTFVSGEPWIGLSDRRIEGVWRWVTGPSPSGFTDWVPPNPNGATNQNCGELNGGGWHDDSCNVVQPFLCECDGLAPDPAAF